MKLKLALLGLLSVLQGIDQAMAAEKTVTLQIESMICGPDPHISKSSLAAVRGVSDVRVVLDKKTAIVTYDDKNTVVNDLMVALGQSGYSSVPQE